MAKKAKIWTKDECDIIKKYYKVMTYKAISLLLPGITYQSVKQKALVIGLIRERAKVRPNNVWPEHLVSELIYLYSLPVSAYYISKKIKRSIKQIYQKAYRLGLVHVREDGKPQIINRQLPARPRR